MSSSPNTQSKSDLFSFAIDRTSKKMKQSYQKMLKEAKMGITVDQWIVLKSIYNDDGVSQFEIGQKTFKDAPTVTRIIDLLVDKKLVVRVPHNNDRRKFSICLTTSGKSKIKQVLPIVQKFRKASWKGLSVSELNEMTRLLDVIYENLDQKII